MNIPRLSQLCQSVPEKNLAKEGQIMYNRDTNFFPVAKINVHFQAACSAVKFCAKEHQIFARPHNGKTFCYNRSCHGCEREQIRNFPGCTPWAVSDRAGNNDYWKRRGSGTMSAIVCRKPPLRKPRTGGSVWPEQWCPAFSPRSTGLGRGQDCWFCRYADFRLQERVALEVGICCWPRVQTD